MHKISLSKLVRSTPRTHMLNNVLKCIIMCEKICEGLESGIVARKIFIVLLTFERHNKDLFWA